MTEVDRLNVLEQEPDPERLPTGTWLHDLGCPHCGKTCDVCVTQDEIAADLRKQLKGAIHALREIERICAIAGGERSSSPIVVQIVKATRAAIGGQ